MRFSWRGLFAADARSPRLYFETRIQGNHLFNASAKSRGDTGLLT